MNMQRYLIGAVAGTLVAVVASLAFTFVFQPGIGLGFIVGMLFGVVGAQGGGYWWASR